MITRNRRARICRSVTLTFYERGTQKFVLRHLQLVARHIYNVEVYVRPYGFPELWDQFDARCQALLDDFRRESDSINLEPARTKPPLDVTVEVTSPGLRKFLSVLSAWDLNRGLVRAANRENFLNGKELYRRGDELHATVVKLGHDIIDCASEHVRKTFSAREQRYAGIEQTSVRAKAS